MCAQFQHTYADDRSAAHFLPVGIYRHAGTGKSLPQEKCLIRIYIDSVDSLMLYLKRRALRRKRLLIAKIHAIFPIRNLMHIYFIFQLSTLSFYEKCRFSNWMEDRYDSSSQARVVVRFGHRILFRLNIFSYNIYNKF